MAMRFRAISNRNMLRKDIVFRALAPCLTGLSSSFIEPVLDGIPRNEKFFTIAEEEGA